MNTPGYESLASVLTRAYQQAAEGKGKERHAQDRPFTEQPMQAISDLLGNCSGLLYQAMKKIQESQRLDKDAAVRELLGAINYVAGAVIWMEKGRVERPTHWTCSCGHPDIDVPIGQACPECGPRGQKSDRITAAEIAGWLRSYHVPMPPDLASDKKFDRVADAHTGEVTHWVCNHGQGANGNLLAQKVPVGEACTICYALM